MRTRAEGCQAAPLASRDKSLDCAPGRPRGVRRPTARPPARTTPSIPLLVGALALAVPSLARAQAAPTRTGLDVFLRLPVPEREQVAHDLQAQLPATPYVAAILALARGEAPVARRPRLPEKRGERALQDQDPAIATLPRRTRYVFGVGAFEPAPEPKPLSTAPPALGTGGRPGTRRAARRLARAAH